jgi:hypothetical protein
MILFTASQNSPRCKQDLFTASQNSHGCKQNLFTASQNSRGCKQNLFTASQNSRGCKQNFVCSLSRFIWVYTDFSVQSPKIHMGVHRLIYSSLPVSDTVWQFLSKTKESERAYPNFQSHCPIEKFEIFCRQPVFQNLIHFNFEEKSIYCHLIFNPS